MRSLIPAVPAVLPPALLWLPLDQLPQGNTTLDALASQVDYHRPDHCYSFCTLPDFSSNQPLPDAKP